MSGKSKKDYISVLHGVKQLLPEAIALSECMVDFEEAMWKAIRDVYPAVNIKGCAFHWKQAVWRHNQSTGLQIAYMEDEATFKLLRKVMSLPCLPVEVIPDMFTRLRRQATTGRLEEVFQYIQMQWIESAVMPPST
ncbi:uncharacterized protein LOC100367179 [Saccoglossus kowalevskii]|uniref:Uncharacterized protein LOC100367179 n=1 Tax=Saccoglossus kowalevskii TaxID=10224 RepID=A0ABM0GW46_SACKO|nr:PREDICTED: uncharacterized protein LOC100376834 [Saccoglossus kowalevskii]XP_002739631.1 PREDICTED: uncharacterized protein LOC100367179 [Saccoglossus kowalevskii]